MTRATALAEAASILRAARVAIDADAVHPDERARRMLEIHDRWIKLAGQASSDIQAQESDTVKSSDDGLPVVRSFRTNEATAARLSIVAKARGMSASDLIRESVQAAINAYSGVADE